MKLDKLETRTEIRLELSNSKYPYYPYLTDVADLPQRGF